MQALSLWIWPLASGLSASVFTVLIARQYLERRKPHQLAWTVGFAMWAAAAFMETAALLAGEWSDPLYRAYIIVSSVLVPVLAYGTLRLVTRKAYWNWIYVVLYGLLVGVFAYGVLTVHPLVGDALVNVQTPNYAGLGDKGTFPRMLAAFIAIPASFVLFGGAIRSVWMFVRKSEFAYRMWANVIIAAATFVIAGSGRLAATGHPTLFYVAELASAVLFIWGFLLAGSLKRGGDAVRAKRAAERG